MPTICPKCRTIRPDDILAPDWQCPACGVAYAKAGSDGAALLAAGRSTVVSASSLDDNNDNNEGQTPIKSLSVRDGLHP